MGDPEYFRLLLITIFSVAGLFISALLISMITSLLINSKLKDIKNQIQNLINIIQIKEFRK
jgi:hypothetical protein